MVDYHSCSSDRSSAAVWGLLLLGVGALAAAIDLGALHRAQNADSLLLVLISLQHWTPFFWGQDRFGMLVPLIALPLHDPLVNLLVQGWLTTVAALVAPFLVARDLGNGNDWIAVGALTNSCLFLFAVRYQFDWLVTQPYALSLTLAFGALLAADRTDHVWTGAAVGLMLLAHWVNLSVCLIVLPCIAIGRRPFGRRLAIAAAGLAGGVVFKHLSTAPSTTLDVVAIDQWPHGWMALLGTMGRTLEHRGWLAVVAAAACASAFALWRRGSLRSAAKSSARPVAIAIVYWIAIGTFAHVQLNDYFPRYALPALLFAGVALATMILAPLNGRPLLARTMTAAVFVVAAVATYGRPSLSGVRKALDRNLGTLTSDVIRTGATVVAGDYWTVWPAVFHANMTLYRRPGRRPVFGLTYRSDLTDSIWLNCGTSDIGNS